MEEKYRKTFKKGTIVEISSEDEGLRGSWYTATVIRTLSSKTQKLLIEYHNLFADEAGFKPLREFIDPINVRPIPPVDNNIINRSLTYMDDVDAFHNDGWWEGVVTRVYDDGSCAVFFRCSREQIVFSTCDLRVHREWILDNLWLPPCSSSTCQNKKNEENKEQRMNGNISGDKDRVSRNGEVTNARKRSWSISRTQDGLAKNGNYQAKRKTSNALGNKNVANGKRKVSKQKSGTNSNGNKLGVRRNGKLKEPRKRATTNTGRIHSKK